MKTRRHAKILELIKAQDIDTQEELLRNLRACGFDVTQATVSRDIKELRLLKVLSESGGYKYATADKAEHGLADRFIRIFSESVISITPASNLVVIKTIPGLAPAASSAIDAMNMSVVVGSLAGDDTVVVIMRDLQAAIGFCAEIRRLLN